MQDPNGAEASHAPSQASGRHDDSRLSHQHGSLVCTCVCWLQCEPSVTCCTASAMACGMAIHSRNASLQGQSGKNSNKTTALGKFRASTPSKAKQHSHTDIHSPRPMRPIATPASTSGAVTSPRTAAQTSTSRPGSPISTTQTLHVTSRSQAEGAPPPAPPPPHMMLQTNPAHAAVRHVLSEWSAKHVFVNAVSPRLSAMHAAAGVC